MFTSWYTSLRIDLIFSFSSYAKKALKMVNRVKSSDFYVNYVFLWGFDNTENNKCKRKRDGR